MIFLLRCTIYELCGHIACLIIPGMRLEEVGEEEYLQYGKDNEQLNEYDGPERTPEAHRLKPLIVEVEGAIEKPSLIHRLGRNTAANIRYFQITSK